MKLPIGRIFKIFFVGLVVFFLGDFFLKHISELETIHLQFEWKYLVISFLFSTASSFFFALIWYFITKRNHCAIPFGESVFYRTLSDLGKYIPGAVIGYVYLLSLYKKQNHSRSIVTSCMLIENIGCLLSAIVISFLALFWIVPAFITHSLWLIVLFFFLCAFLSHPRVLQFCLNFLLHLIKKDSIQITISYPTVLFITFLYALNWIVLGLSVFFLFQAFFPIGLEHIPLAIGALTFSAFLGILAIFAPSGIGIREGAFIFLFSSIMPASIATIGALISRLLITLSEVAIFGVMLFGKKFLQK